MATKLTKKDVFHVAKLANLSLSEEEAEKFAGQLQDILEYAEQLDKVDTSGVEPTYQTLDGTTNVWREDEVTESLSQEEAVSQAKRVVDGYFVTDSVFGVKEVNRSKQEETEGNRRGVDKLNAVLTEISIPFRTDRKTIGHKDLFLTKGIETTAGSNVLLGYVPQYSSTVVERLDKAGYTTKFKFNCDAWAHGSSGENSDFGPVKNPWNLEFTPGGSSSGSAAAVAAGLVDFASGTDTGGSIRLPASFCNLVGLKSTYGSLSRYGIVAMGSSLDSPGFLARTVADVRKLFGIVSQADKNDASSQSVARKKEEGRRKKGIKIGLPKEFFAQGVDQEVKDAVMAAADILEKNGARIIEVSLPNTRYGIGVYYLVQTTEVASNLARYDGIRYGHDRSSFGAEAKRRIMLGTYASSAGYSDKFFEKAARVRTLLIRDFQEAFSKVDVLLGPVSPTPPFKLGEKTSDPLAMYLSDILTVSVNLTGLPGLALPCGFYEGRRGEGKEGQEGERQYQGKAILPIGMQIIGPRWSEDLLFDVGEIYQGLTKWHEVKPI